MRLKTPRLNGSALVVVLLTIVILTFAAGTVLRMSGARFRYTMQAGAWQEAVYSAEAGANMAVAALRDSQWAGWQDGTGASVSTPPRASSTSPPPAADLRIHKTLLKDTAEPGGNEHAVIVTMDAPTALRDTAGQWYRVRATAAAELPGSRRLGYEPGLFMEDGSRQNAREKLRRFSFFNDFSVGLLTGRAQAVRTIEVIIRPNARNPWVRALTLRNKLTMNGGGFVDSFDSGDPTKSTNRLYDLAKRQSNGDVGLVNSTGSNLNDNFVYGDLAYTGPDVLKTDNVQGTISSPFDEPINPVLRPTWPVINLNPGIIDRTMTLTGGPAGAPARFKVSEVKLNGGSSLALRSHAPGEESYIEVWVTGNMTTAGNAFVEIPAGVHVTYYVEGDIKVTGSTFINRSNIASNLQINGVSPASGTNTMHVSGNSDFIGVVNAPHYDLTITGSGDFSGAFIGNTAKISGGASVHYDEALGSVGGRNAAAFSVVSWVEDAR